MIKPHGSETLNPLYVADDAKRAALEAEAAEALEYLREQRKLLTNAEKSVWIDFARAVFTAKEFIYVK